MAGTSRYQFNYVELLLIHLGMALAVYFFRPSSSFILLGVIVYFLFLTIVNENKNNEALMGAAYIAGGEVFFRQTDAMFFYETGKYMVIVFLLIGMFFKGTSSRTAPYWTYLFILIPGIVVASITMSYDSEVRKLVAFNLSGPVALGVSAIYCYYKKIQERDFKSVISFLLMPLIAHMFYLYLYTPSMMDVGINLQANYAATGGYGPNQISTVFGFGAVLLAMRLFVVRHKLINLIDLVLLGMMGYRALITFSRGGVFTAVICIAAFLIFLYYKRAARERNRLNFKIFLLGGTILLLWLFSLVQTGGLLGNRYTNRDAAGELKKDITTGRAELIETELQAFINHPVTGIGVGKGYEYRLENQGISIATHNELSRMLSEHGLLGLVAILILILVPIIFWTKFKNNYYFLAFLAFWFLTINHSAMRIALPAFVYGLALLYIVDDKKHPVHRKRLTNQ
ncbi:O-antigen ligase family protein [Salegentibacter maritimus]|uniref:O-antigen ligase family protein n=1 Tax=Salegentibacter maritimus TaxID=2794347 RepID=UPI0018E429EE|nr:O-antigen ligase family protein [Salegentibacter maritimus]MBI6116703.1 O-antigen ligase family protein [Salegentibacter maritimus]